MNLRKFFQILIIIVFGAGAAAVVGVFTAALVSAPDIPPVFYSQNAYGQTNGEMQAEDRSMSTEERATLKHDLNKWDNHYAAKIKLSILFTISYSFCRRY